MPGAPWTRIGHYLPPWEILSRPKDISRLIWPAWHRASWHLQTCITAATGDTVSMTKSWTVITWCMPLIRRRILSKLVILSLEQSGGLMVIICPSQSAIANGFDKSPFWVLGLPLGNYFDSYLTRHVWPALFHINLAAFWATSKVSVYEPSVMFQKRSNSFISSMLHSLLANPVWISKDQVWAP